MSERRKTFRTALFLAMGLAGGPLPSPADTEEDLAANAVLAGALVMMYGGYESLMAVAEDGESADFPKISGTPRLSYVRLDTAWQDLASDTGTQEGVDAWDLGATAGFGPFAGQYRQTRFDTLADGERPRLHQSYFLYRMSYLAILEWNLGAGASALEREDMGDTYLSFTSPVRIHLPYLCLEAIPSWSEWDGERFRDLEFAAIAHLRGIGLRAGYRWLEAPGIGDVSGAFAGVSLFW